MSYDLHTSWTFSFFFALRYSCLHVLVRFYSSSKSFTARETTWPTACRIQLFTLSRGARTFNSVQKSREIEDIWCFQCKIKFYFTEWTPKAVFSQVLMFMSEVKFDLTLKQVAQRATIAHLSPMCQVNLPRNLMQPFTHPNDATHKIWSRMTNWLQRYSSSKVWNFRHSRASNSKMSGVIRPKIELNWAFMPVLDTSNFDDDSIKNEQASMETPFSYNKSMGNFFWRSRAANSVVGSPIWLKFKLVRDYMHVLVTCKYKKDRIKSNREKVETPFSPL